MLGGAHWEREAGFPCRAGLDHEEAGGPDAWHRDGLAVSTADAPQMAFLAQGSSAPRAERARPRAVSFASEWRRVADALPCAGWAAS
eukprot:1617246-Alexandrium_andersonii.AAC.1